MSPTQHLAERVGHGIRGGDRGVSLAHGVEIGLLRVGAVVRAPQEQARDLPRRRPPDAGEARARAWCRRVALAQPGGEAGDRRVRVPEPLGPDLAPASHRVVATFLPALAHVRFVGCENLCARGTPRPRPGRRVIEPQVPVDRLATDPDGARDSGDVRAVVPQGMDRLVLREPLGVAALAFRVLPQLPRLARVRLSRLRGQCDARRLDPATTTNAAPHGRRAPGRRAPSGDAGGCTKSRARRRRPCAPPRASATGAGRGVRP